MARDYHKTDIQSLFCVVLQYFHPFSVKCNDY
jgi:hypothetical protein